MIARRTQRLSFGSFSRHHIFTSRAKVISQSGGKLKCFDKFLEVPRSGSSTARQMSDKGKSNVSRLLLIRHGETTDNVAGLLGGSSDSPLTNHGFQQATRLGTYLAEQGYRFTNIFSSDLSRAFKTAEAIRMAQPKNDPTKEPRAPLKVIALKELQEQDFGSFERKPYAARYADATELRNDPNFKDIETTQAMIRRAKVFIMKHLLPALEASIPGFPTTIAVVSHGVLLTTLWRCILSIQRPNTIKLDPEVAATLDLQSLEYLGGWSNTGHLVLELEKLPSAESTGVSDGGTPNTTESAKESATPEPSSSDSGGSEPSTSPQSNFSILIRAVNCKEHLQGLKRTGGGVGSSKHDESQKSIDGFFKRQKLS